MGSCELNGHVIKNIRIEPTYKGNYHLYADIDGKEQKFIISRNKEDFSIIEKTGLSNLTADYLIAMGKKYFML